MKFSICDCIFACNTNFKLFIMKRLVFVLSAVLFFASLSAQDFIYKNDGGEIEVKVIEITPDVIKYKKYEFLDGPLYNIKIDDIFMIVYENGHREVYKKKENSTTVEPAVVPVVAPVIDKPSEVKQESGTSKNDPKKESNQSINSEFSPNIQFGITAGFNISSARYNYKNKDAQPTGGVLLGFMGGMTVNFHIAKKFGIQTGLYYMGKGDNLNLEKSYSKALSEQYPGQETKIDGSFKNVLGYLQIPVSFNFAIPMGGTDNYVYVGPGAYFAYGIYGKEKPDFSVSVKSHGTWTKVYEDHDVSNVKFVSTVPSEIEKNTKYVKGMDLGAIINIGIKSKKLMVSSITSIGLVNTRPDKTDSSYNPDDEKVKTLCGSIAFTYFFN